MTHASHRTRRRLAPIAMLAALAICLPTHGFIPIKTGSGIAIAWPGGTLEYVVNSPGPSNIADGSEQLAVRLAFQTWGTALTGGLTISEDTTSDPTSTNTSDTATHRVLFDENDATGYFPAVTGIVALTPVWFTAGGAILDADVIFNGRDHTFSTNLAPSTFDVRDVATHEIGHFLGLDHSAIGGATMFPYVATKQIDHRSLSDDDVAGMRNAYAGAGPPTGSLSGVAFHLAAGGGAGTPIRGGYVTARRGDGTVAAAALTKQDGSFSVRELVPGSYALTIVPLDGPMTPSNSLTPGPFDVDFGCAVLGVDALTPTFFAVAASADTSAGAFIARAADGPAITSLFPSTPLRLLAGGLTAIVLNGSGFTAGCSIAVSGSGVTVTNVTPLGGGTSISATLSAASNAATGLRDLLVIDVSGRVALEPGGLDVELASPAVATVAPASGSSSGGTAVTIGGSSFQAGATVIFGDALATSVNVVTPGSITAVTPARGAGTVDVVVVNPDCNEGRKVGAFTFNANPAISSIFPTAGSSAGGTLVHVNGLDFLAGATVTIGGAPAVVSAVTPTRIDVTAPALALGFHDVVVTNPDTSTTTATNAYRAVAAADPVVAQIAPATSPIAGGVTVSITGSAFTAGAAVRFGASVATGAGGAASPSVTFVNPTELQVTVPAAAGAGAASVIVSLPSGQSATYQSFAYTAASSSVPPGGGGGGGGGCVLFIPLVPPSPTDQAGALASFALLVLAAWGRAALRRPTPRTALALG